MQSDIDAAILPLLWRGIAIGIALAACGTAIAVRATRRAAPERVPVRTREVIAIAILTAISAAFAATALRRPFGTDEAATFLYYASKPLHIGLTIYGSPNNHLLNTALMHVAWTLFGDSEATLRLPAFLAGVALVPLTWLAARRLSPHGSVFAAGLVAGAPAVLDYATNARGYTLVATCTLVAAASMIDVMRDGGRRSALTFAIASALGFYAVPVMLYPFAAIAACAFFLGRERRAVVVAVVASIFFTAALYAPVIAVSGFDAITSNAYVRPLSWPAFFAGLAPYVATVFARMFAGFTAVGGIAIVIAAVLRPRFRSAIVVASAVIVVILIAQRVLPFPRIWLPLLPLLFIAASSWWRMPRIEAITAIVVASLFGSVWTALPRSDDTGVLPDVIGIAQTLQARVAPGDAVAAATPSDLPLAFYLRKLHVAADVLNPDLAHARRIFVVVNDDAGMTLPRTLAALRIDPRPFVMRRVAESIFELDRRL